MADQQHYTIEVRCAVCKRKAQAERIVATLPSLFAEWLQPPEGWWVYAGGTYSWQSPHLRCPGCL